MKKDQGGEVGERRGEMVHGAGERSRCGQVRVVRSKEVDMKGQLASRVQGDVWAWVMTNGQVLFHGLGTAKGAYVGVYDSCRLWGLPRGLWLRLDPGITLVSKGHTATGAMPGGLC